MPPRDCFLEVHLDYHIELHDLNDYPLVGEKMKLVEKMLQEYQLQIIENNNFSLGKNKRLIPNLGKIRKYKFHYQNFIDIQGCNSKKIHRILEFKEEPFLKPYIQRNTELRREAEKEGNKIKKQNAKLRKTMLYLVNRQKIS